MCSGIDQSLPSPPLFFVALGDQQGGGGMAPLCSPLGKCPFPQHSLKAGMFYLEKDTSYLNMHFLGVGFFFLGGGAASAPTFPPGSTALDHGQVLT